MEEKIYKAKISYGHDKERELIVTDGMVNTLKKAFRSRTNLEVTINDEDETTVLVNMEFVQEISISNARLMPNKSRVSEIKFVQ